MPEKEAKARIKINKLLEEAGWHFFDFNGYKSKWVGLSRIPVTTYRNGNDLMARKPDLHHFHEREYAKQLLDCKAWTQGSPIHFHVINQIQDHLEIWLYVKGKLTEKLIFDKQ